MARAAGRDIPRHAFGQAIPGPAGTCLGRQPQARPGSCHLQPPVRLLQPLLRRGDFLSKRRYSRKEKYAIPYNGEEVYLHWANSDQYYVKTGEHFTDYRFRPAASRSTSGFQQADVAQNNVKGDKRFFLPLPKEAAFDAKARRGRHPVRVPAADRGRADSSTASATSRTRSSPRAGGDSRAVCKETMRPGRADRRAPSGPADGEQVSLLAHHLRQYTQRNTSDFFIHKDLKGFLTRELDFYLKNEVLNLDEMEAAGESAPRAGSRSCASSGPSADGSSTSWPRSRDFQKMLFEKKRSSSRRRSTASPSATSPRSFYPRSPRAMPSGRNGRNCSTSTRSRAEPVQLRCKSKSDRRVVFLKGHPRWSWTRSTSTRVSWTGCLASFDDLDDDDRWPAHSQRELPSIEPAAGEVSAARSSASTSTPLQHGGRADSVQEWLPSFILACSC